MRNGQIPGGRQHTCLSDQFQRSGILRNARSILFFCFILSLPASLGSCKKIPAPADDPAPEVPPVADSVSLSLRLDAGGRTVRRLDLFCYSGAGTEVLLLHRRCDGLPDTLSLKVPEEAGTVVCVANSPHAFNLNALGRLDAMKQLRFNYLDDNPTEPVLGGMAEIREGACSLSLAPLLCCITLVSVANTMDGYELLEEPRVRLRDIPDSAEILREADFRPSELIDAGPWTALPYDVGYFPQKSGIKLWCYPNDTPENVLGTPRPCLEFECQILGKTCTFEVPLPPLPRGCSKEVELIVNGPGDYRYKIR